MKHPKYRADVDGLRAVAVLAVVFFHAFPHRVPGGFIGVDVFFVISGYLISTILFENLDAGTFSFSDFYARRIRRIFPALFIVLAACVLAGWFLLLPAEYRQLGKHIAGASAFISNFMFWREAGYFDNSAESKPLLHLWSLGIEEQFYIVWPLLVWLAWKIRLNVLTIILIVLVASFTLSAIGVTSNSIRTFYSPQTRFWELLAGSLLAWLHFRQYAGLDRMRGRMDDLLARVIFNDPRVTGGLVLANVQASVGILMILFGMFALSRNSLFPGPNALMPVVGTLLIISAGSKSWLNGRALSSKLLVWVGLISYPLYLWHWPLLSFAHIVEGGVPDKSIRLAAVIIAFFGAWVTYRFIEMPTRRGRSTRSTVFVWTLLMIGVGYFGFNIYSRDGYEFRKNIRDFVIANSQLQWPPVLDGDDTCRNRYQGYGYCKIGQDSVPTVAIIGDSFANAYFVGLAEEYARRGENVVMLGAAGCPPLLNITGGPIGQGDWCHDQTANALNAVAADKDIHTVILAANWHLYINGSRFGPFAAGTPTWILRSKGATTREQNNAEAFVAQFENTIRTLQDAGKKVIVLKQNHELNYYPVQCIGRRPITFSSHVFNCEISADSVNQYLNEYETVMDPVLKKFKGVAIWDPIKYFCDKERCFSMHNGMPLFRDSLHLSIEGSRYLADKLMRE